MSAAFLLCARSVRAQNETLTGSLQTGYTEIQVFAVSATAVSVATAIFVYWRFRLLKAQDILRRERDEFAKATWFQSVLEAAPDATFIIDRDGTIVHVNRQAERSFRADRDKLIGLSVDELVPAEIRKKHADYRNSFVTASAPREMAAAKRLSARRFDGTEFPAEISLNLLDSKDGPIHIVASVRDASVRRAMEDELHEQGTQLRAVLDNMSSGVLMVDKAGKIVVFNRMFLELFNFRNVSPGMPIADLLYIRATRGEYGIGDPADLVEARLEKMLNSAPSVTEDVAYGERIIETRRAPTGGGGVVCMYTDITQRKVEEAKLAEKSESLSRMNDVMSRYLSPQICKQIVNGDMDARVDANRKRLTIFFSDIVNFTSTTEGLEPEEITLLLNDYLTKMTEIALAYGGTIDKYIGDAILIFFGDPDTNGAKADATAAVQMAIEMQRRCYDLRAKWEDLGYKNPFHIRCGVTTGYCNVGNFGSDQRIDYTIVGSQVNLAARLESICAPDSIVIAESTYRLVRDVVRAEPLEPVTVKGVRDPVLTYGVQGIFDEWDSDERYIRRETDGLRLWVDLKHMDAAQRADTILELEQATQSLKTKPLRAVNDQDENIA